jgi:phosphoadenosine phosphosulfate reductase
MNITDTEKILQLNARFAGRPAEELVHYFIGEYGDEVALASSLSAEDQVLTHMMLTRNPKARIFTLDTGRLFPETYDLIARTNARYKTGIRIYFPDRDEVEQMVAEKGINLFYDSIENRKRCCHVRKVMPLQRAFKGLDAWICGLRREQSVTRLDAQLVEWDAANGLIKVNPLINWEEEQVWEYIHQHNVPYNPLHDKGFPSIGCQPCTREVEKGEDPRAGRWWWENPDSRECGLHPKK